MLPGGPEPHKSWWKELDFLNVLPLNEASENYYVEVAVVGFLLDGCFCKLNFGKQLRCIKIDVFLFFARSDKCRNGSRL
jgi:hypothetical protein